MKYEDKRELQAEGEGEKPLYAHLSLIFTVLVMASLTRLGRS